jgi:hypothetical protein
MLDPAIGRVNLRKFGLGTGNSNAPGIENNRPTAGRALINRKYALLLCHDLIPG